MRSPERRSNRLPLGIAGFVLAAVAIAAGVMFFTMPRSGKAEAPVRAVSALETATPRVANSSSQTTASRLAKAVTASPKALVPVKPKPAAKASKTAAAKQSGPSLVAYRGLGSWVDIYDDKAWKNPSAAVRDMSRHGVRTLYIETANSRSPSAIYKPAAMRTFIREAHARKMRVVAWYLPDMKDLSKDYSRIAQAIRFRTPDGQKFDSFALDIESGAVRSVSVRNRALSTLSTKIRRLAGPTYPLGAITPSPVGLSRKGSYWGKFPYEMLAKKYDVFVPMSYYTYHVRGAGPVHADTLANVRILRAQKGCSATPIHLIGGLSENSTPAEVQAFVRAERQARCIGAGLYGWPGTTHAHWRALKSVLK